MSNFRIIDPELVPKELRCEPDCSVVRCAGSHAKIRGALDKPCKHCEGSGKVRYYHEDFDTCPTCHGSGRRQIPGVERLAGEKE